MDRIFQYLSTLLAILLLSGCFRNEISYPVYSTSIATTDSPKTGTFTCRVRCSDALEKAMENGGITKIHHVEETLTFVLIIIPKTTVTVHGE